MSRNLNKAEIIGYLGSDPEMRFMPNGKPVTNISVATTETWKDRDTGERKEHTEWHRIVMFQRLAEIASEYLRKGSLVYIEGRLRTRKWQDKEGRERYTTEIVADRMLMLGGKRDGDHGSSSNDDGGRAYAEASGRGARANRPVDEFDDDIPF